MVRRSVAESNLFYDRETVLTASAALISVSPTSRPLKLSRASVRPYLPRIYGQSELSTIGRVAPFRLGAVSTASSVSRLLPPFLRPALG